MVEIGTVSPFMATLRKDAFLPHRKNRVELQEPALKELISFLFITGCTSSPRSFGLLKKVKIDKAVKSSRSASHASQNVSYMKQ